MEQTLEQKVNEILRILENHEPFKDRIIRYIDKKTDNQIAAVFDPMFIPHISPKGYLSSPQFITITSEETNWETKRYKILQGEYNYEIVDNISPDKNSISEEELTIYIEEVK